MTPKERQQEYYSAAILLGLIALYLLTSCATVNLECDIFEERDGTLIQRCHVPKEDQPVGERH